MKGRKRGPARALAIMMSAILIVSSMGLTAFADEQIQGSSDAGFYEETAATGTEDSAQEDESLPGDGSTEEEPDIEEQGIGEGTGDLSADETDDDHPADDETGNKETTDNDSQDDSASSADAQSGDEGKKGKTYYISIRVRKKVNGIDYYTTFGVPKKIKVVK